MIPRWLTLLILVVLGYLIYVGSKPSPVSAPTTSSDIIPKVTEEDFPALAKLTDGERWKRKLDPSYAARMNCSVDAPAGRGKLGFKVIEEVIGEGNEAACGDTLRVQLTIWNNAGGKAYDEPVTLALGSRDVAAGLDAGLVGIKPQGVRSLVLPPHALAHSAETKMPAAVLAALPEGKTAIVTAKRLK